jgi:hypothetical protein
VLTVTPAATVTQLTASASSIIFGASVTFTATVTSAAGIPTGSLELFDGTVMIGTTALDPHGAATFSSSSLPAGTSSITAIFEGSTNFASSSSEITELVDPGIFTLSANPPVQFVRGAGSTVYTVTATAVEQFNGPVTLSCSGLPVGATCSFAAQTLNLVVGGTATTSMTIVNTAADAQLRATPFLPGYATPGSLAPITLAAVFPFELTGLGACFAGLFSKKNGLRPGRSRTNRANGRRAPKLRLALALFCTAGLLSLAGCACFTSIYQNYTVTITGTTTVPGIGPQSATVVLTVGAQ